MSEQQTIEISGRLRELKAESSETNESIADAVGVKERTVAGWLSPTNPQSISYDNAKKVADLFQVTIDWLWRGEETARVPADFMERFAALEAEVRELRQERSEKRAQRASGAAAQARQKSRSKSQPSRSSRANKKQAD